MESKTAVGHPDDDERCSHCGACKHCGHGGRPQFIPMPYPVYPPVVAPYRPPYMPYTQPLPRWTPGLSPNICGSGGTTFTSRQTTNGIYQH